MNFIQNIQW